MGCIDLKHIESKRIRFIERDFPLLTPLNPDITNTILTQKEIGMFQKKNLEQSCISIGLIQLI